MPKNKIKVSRKDYYLRKHKIQFSLNDKEKAMLDDYCKKNKISNRSEFIRKKLMADVFNYMVDEHYPRLFDV